MAALDDFVEWLKGYVYVDRNNRLPTDLKLQYHSRSDEHSKKLGELLVQDLLATCEVIRQQANRGDIAYSINHPFTWPNGKIKTLDLAIGIPQNRRMPFPGQGIYRLNRESHKAGRPAESFSRLLIACEEKAVMTEHGKSQPRIYSELNDSHTIVHAGSQDTIAAGIAMVNIAATFVSPLRQRRGSPIVITTHVQPLVTRSTIEHLRKLPMRDTMDAVGLDAYCTFVVDVDNQGSIRLHTDAPAPQPGDRDHYDTFLKRICRFYVERFSDLDSLPARRALTVEDSLVGLAQEHPGLLEQTGQLAVENALSGATELQAILDSIELQANPPVEEQS